MGLEKAAMVLGETSTGPGMKSLMWDMGLPAYKIWAEMQWLLLLLCCAFFGVADLRAEGVSPAGKVPPLGSVLSLDSDFVRNVLKRDEVQGHVLDRYEYRQQVLAQDIDGDGKVSGSSGIDMIVHPGNQEKFTIVGDEKGPLRPEQVTEAQHKEARTSEKIKSVFSLKRIAPRFELRLVGEEVCDGKAAWLVAFTSREGQPYANRLEKILNNLSGRLWVAKDDYSIVRTEATLARPVAMAWLFATMNSVSVSYRTVPLEQGRGPVSFEIDYRAGVLWGELHQRHYISMSGYRVL